MIDLALLRKLIAAAPPSGPAAILTRDTLEEFERDLASGSAARVELARMRAFETVREGVGA